MLTEVDLMNEMINSTDDTAVRYDTMMRVIDDGWTAERAAKCYGFRTPSQDEINRYLGK